MLRPTLVTLLALLLLLSLLPTAHPQAVIPVPADWSYDDSSPRGPSHWAALDPPSPMCSSGLSQSPIDLPLAFPPSSPSSLAIHWDDLHSSVSTAASTPNSSHTLHDLHTVINTGHSIQVKFDPTTTASHVTFRTTDWSLLQFHFHAPSEHTIAAHHHDMELHLVHASPDGALLVVGVFIDADPNEEEEERERRAAGQGAGNSASDFLKALTWSHLPASLASGRPSSRPLLHLLSSTLSSSHSPTFYSYIGSLTTPPCTEGVQWFVATEPLHISTAELAVYSKLFHHTARPVQPLHSRAITLVTTPSSHPIAFALLVLGLLLFAGVVGGVWGCVRLCHHDTLEEGLTAAMQENVERDKEADKQWVRDRAEGPGRGGGGSRPSRRSSGGGSVGGGGLVREEEDTAPLLPAPFSSSSLAMPKASNSPLTTMLRRATNGKGGSNGNLADAWKGSGGLRSESPAISPDSLSAR